MTTILHAADLHQGILTHSRPDPATGIPSRILDLAEAWGRVVDVALEEEVDVVILAGDVFHVASPDAISLVLFADELARLVSAGIPTVIIPGNHDRAPHSGKRSVLEAFHDGDLVKVATVPRIEHVADVAVACLPSTSRVDLASRVDRAGVSVDRAFSEELYVDALRSAIAELASAGADVLTLHTSIAGAMLGTEKDLAIIAEPMLSPADLEGPWRYVAAGHIHRAQTLGENGSPPPAIRYSGSIAPLTFGEEGDHGVSLLEIDDKWAAGRHVPIESRPVVSLEWSEAIAADEELEDAIVRVRNTPPEGVEDMHAKLERWGAWIVKVETAREDRPAVPWSENADGPPTTREALEAWLSARVEDTEERARILELAGDL